MMVETRENGSGKRVNELELLRGDEGQAAPAFEELAQAAVAGTARTTQESRRDLFAGFAPGTAAAQPIFPAYRPINRDRRGLWS